VLINQDKYIRLSVWSRTLLKIINLIFPSSFIQIGEGCNTNFEGFEQRPGRPSFYQSLPLAYRLIFIVGYGLCEYIHQKPTGPEIIPPLFIQRQRVNKVFIVWALWP
jgi:hypothetical protein